MQIIQNLNEIPAPYQNAVVTIGNFDGVHKGHQALLRMVRRQADTIDGTTVAITFEPHPMRILAQDPPPPHITRFDQKMELLDQTGNIDVLLCIPFTMEFASITAGSFLKDILIDKIGMKAIIVGKDYAFGKDRKGNIAFLKQTADAYDFQVIVVDWENTKDGTERISSTRIRNIVKEGHVAEARSLLGRYYQIRGKVVDGRKRGGRLLGFPTANIHLHDELCPKTGVYAVTVECQSGRYNGVANIGYSPTFDDHIFTIEVHILDFNDNIYGQRIRVNFVERLRSEIKFSGLNELSEQIQKDIEKARQILA